MLGHSSEAPHLEFEGATLTVGEEIASALADELDGVAASTGLREEDAALEAEAHALARELRLWVFLASVCSNDRAEREQLVERLERLGWRLHELVDEPEVKPVRGPAASLEEAHNIPLTGPRYVMQVVDIHGEDGHGFEDEVTDVKRAKWDRNTNRALSPMPGGQAPLGLSAYVINNEETPPV